MASSGGASSSSGASRRARARSVATSRSANRFLFELDGVEIGVFKEVHGLEVTVGVDEIPRAARTATPTACPAG